MTILNIRKQVKGMTVKAFIDVGKLERANARKARRVMMSTGSFIKTAVSRSMRKAPKKKKITSGPPRWRTKGLKKSIRFRYDPKRLEVVIGPEPRKRTVGATPRGRASTAALMEHGGSAVITVRRGRQRVKQSANYNRRPFMAPQMPLALATMRGNMRKFKYGS